jgi:tetratricopeptide (TPR) repeat protein
VLIGSLGYLAPEQLKWTKSNADPRLEVYGFGATLYYLLSGRLPIRVTQFEQAIDDLVNRRPPKLALYNSRVSRNLEFIVHKCLEKLPEDRYNSLDAVAADLSRYLLGLPLVGQRVGIWKRIKRWCKNEPKVTLSILGTSLLLIVMSVAFAWLWQSSELNRKKVQMNLQMAIQIVQNEQEEAGRFLPTVEGSAKYRIKRLQTAIRFLEQILKTNPNDVFAKRRLAVTHFLMAQVPLRHGRETDVLESLRIALRLFVELAEKTPEDETIKFDIFHTKLAICDYVPYGPERMVSELDTLNVIERLVTRVSGNSDFADAYACQLCRVADASVNQDSTLIELKASDEYAIRAVDIATRLSNQHPDRPNFLRHLIVGKRILANNSICRQQYQAAHAFVEDARSLAERLYREAPDYAENGQLLVLVLMQMAFTELLNHNDREALLLHDQAKKLCQQLIERFPEYSSLTELYPKLEDLRKFGPKRL